MKTIVIVFIALVLLSACETSTRGNYVILIDNSISIPDVVLKRYIASIVNAIVSSASANDRIVVQFIDECSKRQAEKIYFVDLSETEFTSRTDGINHRADSSKARLQRFVTKVGVDLEQAIIAKRKERRSCGSYTDIFHAIGEASDLLRVEGNFDSSSEQLLNEANGRENYQYRSALFIFSDMINEDAEGILNFTRLGGKSEDAVIGKVLSLRDEGKIPSLAGTQVFVYGATCSPCGREMATRQIERVKLFWLNLFTHAGATVVAYGYDTEMEIRKYLKSVDG